MSKTCELIMVDGEWVQHERDMTPAEEAELAARKAAPLPSPQPSPPSVQDQLDAMRKAILTSDKSELQAIDTQLSSFDAVKSISV